MKKTFSLLSPKKKPANQLDSIRHEIKKYIARERRKELPEKVDFWDFDCRIGDSEENSKVIHLSEISTAITEIATENKESFYMEILVKPGHRAKK